jgi:putative endonuclease
MAKSYCVSIMTNQHHTTLYTGFTGDLMQWVPRHRSGKGGWFTRKYALVKLVYFEQTADARQAIAREKQIKAGSRRAKVELIERMNPDWKNLAEGF